MTESAPVVTESVPRQRRPSADPWAADVQARAYVRDCATRGITLSEHPPAAHAQRLLRWMQDEGYGADGEPITFADVQIAYIEMCDALRWAPERWAVIGRRFTPLSGGRAYRSAYCPRTDRWDAKQRVYHIPRVVVAAASVPAVPLRRAA